MKNIIFVLAIMLGMSGLASVSAQTTGTTHPANLSKSSDWELVIIPTTNSWGYMSGLAWPKVGETQMWNLGCVNAFVYKMKSGVYVELTCEDTFDKVIKSGEFTNTMQMKSFIYQYWKELGKCEHPDAAK